MRIQHGHIPELEFELSAVFFGDVGWVDEGLEGFLGVGGGENEYFRGGDWVEPFFDPAPDCGEECWGADYLFPSISFISKTESENYRKGSGEGK
jgi:hypothetical protein